MHHAIWGWSLLLRVLAKRIPEKFRSSWTFLFLIIQCPHMLIDPDCDLITREDLGVPVLKRTSTWSSTAECHARKSVHADIIYCFDNALVGIILQWMYNVRVFRFLLGCLDVSEKITIIQAQCLCIQGEFLKF